MFWVNRAKILIDTVSKLFLKIKKEKETGSIFIPFDII